MLRSKMHSVITEVNGEVSERGELIEYIAIALLTRKNLFILGDTGQAKSYAINEFRKRITGARQFERLLSKQADEDQLFGRLDLGSLIPGNVAKSVLENDAAYSQCIAGLEALYTQYTNEPYNETLLQEITLLSERAAGLRKALSELHGNEPVMVTSGKIPDSHIIFLDEIFSAPVTAMQ